jgi:hypothetical protein
MALQLRQVHSDKSLGLFWTGSTLSTVANAKSFTSFRSAAIEQKLASVSNGIELEIVESVTTQEEATEQNSTKIQIVNSTASLTTPSTKFIAVENSQEGSANFGP